MIKIKYNICHIKSYKYDKNVEYISSENMSDDVKMRFPVISFRVILKLVNKVYNRMSTETLTLNYLDRALKFSWQRHFFTWAVPF